MKGEIEVLDDDGEHEENVEKKIEKDPMTMSASNHE